MTDDLPGGMVDVELPWLLPRKHGGVTPHRDKPRFKPYHAIYSWDGVVLLEKDFTDEELGKRSVVAMHAYVKAEHSLAKLKVKEKTPRILVKLYRLHLHHQTDMDEDVMALFLEDAAKDANETLRPATTKQSAK